MGKRDTVSYILDNGSLKIMICRRRGDIFLTLKRENSVAIIKSKNYMIMEIRCSRTVTLGKRFSHHDYWIVYMVLPVQPLDSGKRRPCFGSCTPEDPNSALLIVPIPTGPVIGLKGNHPTLKYISFHPTLPSKPRSGYTWSLKSMPRWPQACSQGLCGPLLWICPLVCGRIISVDTHKE